MNAKVFLRNSHTSYVCQFYLSTVSDSCDVPLGLEDGSLKDEALSASSSYDEASVGPKNAR